MTTKHQVEVSEDEIDEELEAQGISFPQPKRPSSKPPHTTKTSSSKA